MLNTECRKRPSDNLGLAPPSKRKDIFAARANWGETESHHEESREVWRADHFKTFFYVNFMGFHKYRA